MAGKPPDGGCHGGTISPFAHTATPKLHNTAQARPERITQGQQASRPEGHKARTDTRAATRPRGGIKTQDKRADKSKSRRCRPTHIVFRARQHRPCQAETTKAPRHKASRSQRKAHSHTRHHGPQRGHRRCRLKHQGTGHSLDHANRNKHYAHTNSNLTNKQKTTKSK